MFKNRNYYEYVIKGLNQERFFNELSKKYYIFDVNRYEKNKTSFKIGLKNAKKVKKDIIFSHFEIIGENKRGFFSHLFDIKKHIGFLSAIVFCLIFFAIQFPFVWKVKVDGVENNIQNEITNYVCQNYKLSRDVDCEKIENELRKNFDELSFVSVAVVGQTLVINAKEGIIPIEKNGEFDAIIAPCDCRITYVKLIQGTLEVNEGDTVKKGSVLVQPYIVDSFGETKKVEPKAEIIYETWLEGEESHSDEEIVSIRTGKSYNKNELILFGLKVYEHNGKNKFKEYEVEVAEKFFVKNNILPFVYRKTVVYETKKVLVKKTYDEVRNQKIESAKQKALQKMCESDKIISEDIIESKTGDVYFLKYRIAVERRLDENIDKV